jgi:hypothetical protein
VKKQTEIVRAAIPLRSMRLFWPDMPERLKLTFGLFAQVMDWVTDNPQTAFTNKGISDVIELGAQMMAEHSAPDREAFVAEIAEALGIERRRV